MGMGWNGNGMGWNGGWLWIYTVNTYFALDLYYFGFVCMNEQRGVELCFA